jgi:hypothetical protein
MLEEPKTEKSVEEQVAEILTDKAHREKFLRLVGEMNVDDEAVIILKGHLVLEERLNAIFKKFVFNPDHLERARLTFAQKLAVARSISLDQDKHSLWELVEKLNTLRNKLSHSLDGEARERAKEAVRAVYIREQGELSEFQNADDRVFLVAALALCLGFLHACESEVERFKDYVGELDRVVNPHRFEQKEQAPSKQASASTGYPGRSSR